MPNILFLFIWWGIGSFIGGFIGHAAYTLTESQYFQEGVGSLTRVIILFTALRIWREETYEAILEWTFKRK